QPHLFYHHTPTTQIYTLSLHDALPISDEGRHVVPGRVLPDGRVDPDRQGQPPREEDGRHRHHHGQPQTVPDHLGDRTLPLERHPEVPPHHELHPAEVLDVEWLVETVLLAEGVGLLLGDE